jgi:CRISPR-associated protein Cas2
MLFVICYDVSDDGKREKLSNLMLDYGTRIQESVFECSLTDGEFERMLERVSIAPLGDSDKVRIYRVCSKCVEQVRIYGPGEVTRDSEYYLV